MPNRPPRTIIGAVLTQCKALKSRRFPAGEKCKRKAELVSRIARLLVAVISVAVLLVSIVRAGGDTPIAKAVKSGDIAALRKLIASKADVNEATADGTTPLLWAAYNNDPDMAKALITAGAKLETANN